MDAARAETAAAENPVGARVSALTAIMDQMADVLRTAYSGLDVDVQVEPRLVINPSPPCIDIYPADTPRGTETAGFNASGVDGELFFTVRARVGTADNTAGQDLLLAMMDDEDDLCVAVPLVEDPTLGGLALDTFVQPGSGFGLYTLPDGNSLLGVQFLVTVVNNPDNT